MSSGVRFIFRTLIKVPVIILISYLIFNIFAFMFTRTRIQGLTDIAVQTVAENNFLPQQEQDTLLNYAASFEYAGGLVSNVTIGCDTNKDNDGNSGVCTDVTKPNNDNIKVQYGTPITVTISARYNWIFPFIDTKNGSKADEVKYSENNNNNITITRTVPGLKYYPDLS